METKDFFTAVTIQCVSVRLEGTFIFVLLMLMVKGWTYNCMTGKMNEVPLSSLNSAGNKPHFFANCSPPMYYGRSRVDMDDWNSTGIGIELKVWM